MGSSKANTLKGKDDALLALKALKSKVSSTLEKGFIRNNILYLKDSFPWLAQYRADKEDFTARTGLYAFFRDFMTYNPNITITPDKRYFKRHGDQLDNFIIEAEK